MYMYVFNIIEWCKMKLVIVDIELFYICDE